MSARKGLSVFVLAMLATLAATVTAAADEPAPPKWFKKKTQIQEQRAAEEAAKAAEKPVVGTAPGETTVIEDADGKPGAAPKGGPATAAGASDLTGKGADVDTRTLFTKRGLTDSLGLDYGSLRQPQINGNFLSAQYGLGWWWTPKLTIGLYARAGMMLQNEFLFMGLSLGPQLRYFATKNLALTGMAGYSFTQGLSRVPVSHVPSPPSTEELRARHGIAFGAQVAWMFWVKRDLALGPAINYWHGSSGERKFTLVSFGITYQSGKPNLSGSVMQDW